MESFNSSFISWKYEVPPGVFYDGVSISDNFTVEWKKKGSSPTILTQTVCILGLKLCFKLLVCSEWFSQGTEHTDNHDLMCLHQGGSTAMDERWCLM